MSKKTILIVVLILVVAIGIIAWLTQRSYAKKTAELTPFAQCLTENGALFYGAFWCPACGAQKKMFYGAADELPYVECSNPDKTRTEECSQILSTEDGYPTWIFADGTKLSGVLTLEGLSQLSGCELPETLKPEPVIDVIPSEGEPTVIGDTE